MPVPLLFVNSNVIAFTEPASPLLDNCSALFLPTQAQYNFRTVKTDSAGTLNDLINKFHFLLLSGETLWVIAHSVIICFVLVLSFR